MYRPFRDFESRGRLISVIGSGGKTTLLRYLSRRLTGTVILTTSTRIYPFPEIPLVTVDSERVLRTTLAENRVVCLGTPLENGKLTAPALGFEALKDMADHVLVEADGAAGHPLKAHRPWEPVIPACSDLTVCVVGASGLDQPASRVCHCPELFCELAGIAPYEPVGEAHIAAILNRENLSDWVLVNQTDALADPARAWRLCELIAVNASPCAIAPR